MRTSALAFLLGILLVQQCAELPSFWWGALALPALALAWRWPFCLPLAFLAAGVFWVTLRAGFILGDTLPHELEGRDLELTGYVADVPQPGERGARFRFHVEHARDDGQAVRVPAHVLLNSYDEQLVLRPGERWRLSARLKRPHGFQNPGGFDYEAFLFQQRIRATGYVRGAEALGDGPVWRYGIHRLRHHVGERMRAVLGERALGGIVVALANGDRGGIRDEQWEILRRTGTNHLIAISGLHIGLIAGFAFALARWLWALPGITVLRWPAPKAGALAALVAAAVYAALAGFSVPTQRALVMLGVAMGAVLMQRRVRSTRVLAIALLLVLLYDPLAVMSAGFWLSFAAVAVIVVFINRDRSGRLDWRQLGTLQWGIALGLAPLTLLLFQQVSLSGPLANMLAVPVFAFSIVPLTLAGALAALLSIDAVARVLLELALWPLELVWAGLKALADLPYSLWARAAPTAWAFGCALIGMAWLLAPRGWPARWIGAAWLLPLAFARAGAPAPGEVWLSLLDVGHGLATVVRTHAHTLVYDTGPRFSARFDAGRAVVLPYLRSRGVERIDTLIVSHGDNDHIGGAASLLSALPVGRVLTSVPERLPNAHACAAGGRWEWEGVEFRLLHPPLGYRRRGNNASCVLHVQGRHGAVLLPGDIEASAERLLLRAAPAALAAEVLVVPHQGSKTSSDERFIDAVRPQLALFAVGYRNRFNHPHAEVRSRYERRGVQMFDSAAHGAIEVALGADGVRTQPYRERKRRYWFNR